MAEYVDVDKFAEKICGFQAIDEDASNKMIWLLRTFPTADVVEVVRCKDCKHCEHIIDEFCKDWWQCKRRGNFAQKKPYDFCSYGERSAT